MTSSRAKWIRTELQLSPSLFSGLVGVHVSSVYRLEAMGKEEITLDPFQDTLLEVVGNHLDRLGAKARDDLGRKMNIDLQRGGSLYGLWQLLGVIYA